MKTVPIVSFNEIEPAQKFRDRLLRAGIETKITDETKTEKYWLMSEPLAAIHLEVAETDFQKVAALIRSLGQLEGCVAGAVQCPECASTRVEYPQISRKFYAPRLSSVLLALKILPREFYCLECHYTWPAVASTAEPESDLLGWPRDSKLWHPENTLKGNDKAAAHHS
jgi:hypothetical protein